MRSRRIEATAFRGGAGLQRSTPQLIGSLRAKRPVPLFTHALRGSPRTERNAGATPIGHFDLSLLRRDTCWLFVRLSGSEGSLTSVTWMKKGVRQLPSYAEVPTLRVAADLRCRAQYHRFAAVASRTSRIRHAAQSRGMSPAYVLALVRIFWGSPIISSGTRMSICRPARATSICPQGIRRC